MADQTIIIEVGALEVTSTIEAVTEGGQTTVRVLSQCNGLLQENSIVLCGDASYSEAQFEYDVDQARHRFAQDAAAAAKARQVATDGIVATNTPQRVSAPTVARPGGAQ